MNEKRTVELSDEQIEFIITSLSFSARNIRNAPVDPRDHEMMRARRQEQEEMMSSIREALRQGQSR